MGGQQHMNTFNNIRSNRTTPESRDSTSARPEYPNTDDEEENDL